MHWRKKWQPTPVFLPAESQGREAWWAAVYGVTQSWTRLKQLSSSSKEQVVLFIFNFKVTVTIHSDFGTQKIKSVTLSTVSHLFPISHEVMGPDTMVLVF